MKEMVPVLMLDDIEFLTCGPCTVGFIGPANDKVIHCVTE